MTTNKSRQTIKGIQSQIAKLESDIEIDKQAIRTYQKNLSTKICRLKELHLIEKSFTETKELIVSEHAILRYLQRVTGQDIDKIISEIKNPIIMGLYNQLGGSGKYPCQSFTAVIKNNVIVTIELNK